MLSHRPTEFRSTRTTLRTAASAIINVCPRGMSQTIGGCRLQWLKYNVEIRLNFSRRKWRNYNQIYHRTVAFKESSKVNQMQVYLLLNFGHHQHPILFYRTLNRLHEESVLDWQWMMRSVAFPYPSPIIYFHWFNWHDLERVAMRKIND